MPDNVRDNNTVIGRQNGRLSPNAEKSVATFETLKNSGCTCHAEHLYLQDKFVLGMGALQKNSVLVLDWSFSSKHAGPESTS